MENSDQQRGSFVRHLAKYITEIIVIFVGITISFLFDQWRERQNNVKKEIEFVNSLITDLKAKSAEIHGTDFNGATLLIRNADSLFDSYYNHRTVSDQLALFWMDEYVNRWTFNSSTPTYRSSSATGEWQELPDSLRRKIYDLYEMKFHSLEYRYNTANQMKAQFMDSYLMPQGGMRFMEVTTLQGDKTKPVEVDKIKKLILNQEFVNNLSLLVRMAQVNRESHRMIIENIGSLVADLELYLKKLE